MQPCYYIVENAKDTKLSASVRKATAVDFERTAMEHWQTDWRTDYIQDAALEKCALEVGGTRELVGLGAALLAFGIQLSIDYGYGGAIYLKAKTTQLGEHYMKAYGAIPFSRFDPFLLLIDGEAARELFGQYLKED